MTTPKQEPPKKRPTIGLQITNLVEEYPKLLWRGVVDRAEELDVNVVIFRGESINTPWGYGYQCNVIYDQISPQFLDALIISTGTICNYITKEQFDISIKKMQSIPLVSLSIPIEGVPSIVIDNISGIKEAVRHLVSDHGRRKIAFIQGPQTNNEAQIRFHAFLEAMKEHEIDMDENLIISGNFIERSGVEAVAKLIDSRHAQFDAIIAANDSMALGAMHELMRRNFILPDQVAVIGFDNILDCESILPTLSTIKQPIYQQGRKAVDLALKLINKEKTELLYQYPTTLIRRSSCGCLDDSSENTDQKKNFSKESIMENIKESLSSLDFAPHICNEVLSIVTSMLNYFEGNREEIKAPEELLLKLTKTISSQVKQDINIFFWKDILENLIAFISEGSDRNRDEYLKTLRKAVHLAINFSNNLLISAKINAERLELNTRQVVQELISSPSIDELMRKATELFPRLSLYSCYVFSYKRMITHKQESIWETPRKAKLLLAYDEKTHLKIVAPSDYYVNTEDFIPKELIDRNRRHTFLMMPLYFLEEQYGYIIFDMGIKEGGVYDTLAMEIASTYRSAILLEERQTAEMKLRHVLSELEENNRKLSNLSETDEMTGLYNRRGFISLGEQNLMLAQRMKTTAILYFIDLDGLKTINDTYGHDMGDIAIKACAEILQKVFRKIDLLARLGGDEFVVLTLNTNQDTLGIIKTRLTAILQEYNDTHDYPFKLAMSIGDSSFQWEDTISLAELMAEADKKLYHEKKKKKADREKLTLPKS